jgi:hypothetical protein
MAFGSVDLETQDPLRAAREELTGGVDLLGQIARAMMAQVVDPQDPQAWLARALATAAIQTEFRVRRAFGSVQEQEGSVAADEEVPAAYDTGGDEEFGMIDWRAFSIDDLLRVRQHVHQEICRRESRCESQSS